VTVTEYLRLINLKEKKGYFDSQFQRPPLLGPVILGLWWCGISWWECIVVEVCLSPGNLEAKREREGLGSQYPLQVHDPSELTSFHLALPPKVSSTSQQHHRLWTKPLTYGPSGDI
jgi:hypothetical protein